MNASYKKKSYPIHFVPALWCSLGILSFIFPKLLFLLLSKALSIGGWLLTLLYRGSIFLFSMMAFTLSFIFCCHSFKKQTSFVLLLMAMDTLFLLLMLGFPLTFLLELIDLKVSWMSDFYNQLVFWFFSFDELR